MVELLAHQSPENVELAAISAAITKIRNSGNPDAISALNRILTDLAELEPGDESTEDASNLASDNAPTSRIVVDDPLKIEGPLSNPPSHEPSIEKEVPPSPELILLPANVDTALLGFPSPSASILPDYPELQETPLNCAVTSINGDFALVRATNNGERSFRVVKGPFALLNTMPPIEGALSSSTDLSQDDQFLSDVSSSVTRSAFHDFQGIYHPNDSSEMNHQYRGIDSSALTAFEYGEPFADYPQDNRPSSSRLHLLTDNLPQDKLDRITARQQYAYGILITLNSQNEILITGAGYLSEDGDNRPRNSSGFIITLQRSPQTEELVRYLRDNNVAEDKKRQLLSQIFSRSNHSYAIKNHYDYFTQQPQVDLTVVDRTQASRAQLRAEQIATGETLPSLTFEISSLTEAIYAAIDIANSNLTGKINIIFSDGNGLHIPITQLEPKLMQQIFTALHLANLEEPRRIGRLAKILIFRLEEKVLPDVKNSVVTISETVTEDTWNLLSRMITPVLESNSYYNFTNPHYIYLPPISDRFTLRFGSIDLRSRDLSQLQCASLSFDIGTILSDKLQLSPRLHAISFASTGAPSPDNQIGINLRKLAAAGFADKIVVDANLGDSFGQVKTNLAEAPYQIYFQNREQGKRFKKNNRKLVVTAPRQEGGGWEELSGGLFF